MSPLDYFVQQIRICQTPLSARCHRIELVDSIGTSDEAAKEIAKYGEPGLALRSIEGA